MGTRIARGCSVLLKTIATLVPLASFLTMAAHSASADEAAASPSSGEAAIPLRSSSRDADDLARLDGLIKSFASESHSYRAWAGVSMLTLGAAGVPAGVIMLDRENNSTAGAVTLGVGAGAAVGAVLTLAFPIGPAGRFERLSDLIDYHKADGRPPREIVSAVETAWREQAEASRSDRKLAVIGLAFGALELAGGTYLAFADISGPTFSRKEQYGVSAALFGFGFASILFGFQRLFVEEPIEATWRTYVSGTRQASGPSSVAVGVGPAPGGGVLTVAASF